MLNRRHFHPYRHDRRRGADPRSGWLMGLLGALVLVTLYSIYQNIPPTSFENRSLNSSLPGEAHGGVISVESTQNFSAAEATVIARQNYGVATLPLTTSITKITFKYRSRDVDGTPLTLYGRVYIPDTIQGKLPVFAFSPGTTGIGDKCASSLEQPQVVNWGNYDSHMIMYSSQGFMAVTTDNEGMRDDGRMHHYMVGALEGRALLDSVVAISRLPQTHSRVDTKTVFMGGYSQGGHAAFWADKIAADYTPLLKIVGVVGYGPVMSVKQTLGDVVYGANINWFGPYVLASYQDYYKRNYSLEKILQPVRIPNLVSEVNAHCIDTVLSYWGRDPSKVYQPEFLNAYKAGTLNTYTPAFSLDLDRNATGDQTTASAKRINQGISDNVVLPRQQESILPTMCAKSQGPVQYVPYAATHYDTMVKSFADTVTWMNGIRNGQTPVSTCPVITN